MSPSSLTPPATINELDNVLSRLDDGVLDAIQKHPGDCLVLGAGGKMGYHFSRMLQQVNRELGQGHQVTAVSRFSDPLSQKQFADSSIATIQADLSDEVSLRRLPDAPNLFFLAGVKFGTQAQPELLKTMNQDVPASVAKRYAGSRIVAMSTGCVYSFTNTDSGGSKETDLMEPLGDYARSCIARENAFIEQSEKENTPVAIVRLNYSIDLRYGVLVDIAKAVHEGETIDLSMGYVNVIWQRDAVSQIIRCLPHASSPPWVVNITGDETVSVRWLAEEFAERMGTRPKFVGQDAGSCWLSNSERAQRLFGKPEMSLTTMIDWITDWLTRGMPLLGKPTHFQTRDGNY
ncbi:MAG: NAD(P)-dependent oxidoreductase [Rubripirellula sp.]|nr:NAD(P)-dependent oxidoreductase [Rubripirellula sp.]